jgi:hypothetical protein
MLIFALLIHISLVLQSPIALNIHNRYREINLISPVYFIHRGKWHVTPGQETDVSTVMRNRIEFGSGKDILEGALACKIQRKHAESAQVESKRICLLVAWHVKYIEGLHVRALLVEYASELDEDKLRRLCQMYWYPLNAWVDPIESRWLLDDATMLTIRVKVTNGGYGWNILISEEIGDNIERPFWINAER